MESKAKEQEHAKTLRRIASEEGMKRGGKVKFAKGGGVESKGKTKGKMVVMKRGGKC